MNSDGVDVNERLRAERTQAGPRRREAKMVSDVLWCMWTGRGGAGRGGWGSGCGCHDAVLIFSAVSAATENTVVRL